MKADLRLISSLSVARPFLTMLAMLASIWVNVARAQSAPEAVVSGTLRTATGDSIYGARIELHANQFDVTVRSNFRGQFSARVPIGQVKLSITVVGYEPVQRTLTVGPQGMNVEIQMNRIAQRLADVKVRDKWIGIRGVVGDSSTMQPLEGVEILSGHRNVSIVTDSTGRFEIPLPKAEPTMLRIRREGYQSKPVVVSMIDSSSNDIVIFMTRGVDPTSLKQNLIDFDHRVAWNDLNSFVQTHEELDRYQPKNLMQAMLASNAFVRKGMRLQPMMCLSINGIPQNGAALSMVRFADVELVEVYGADADPSRSLSGKWRRRDCGCNPEVGECVWQIGRKFVMYVNVWSRR